jgi:hypothetical protein
MPGAGVRWQRRGVRGSAYVIFRSPSSAAARPVRSTSHAAWDVHAVHGMHTMYSVRKLGTAHGQLREQLSRQDYASTVSGGPRLLGARSARAIFR